MLLLFVPLALAVDRDGDGYDATDATGAVLDCNDFNPAVHPLARELCNRRDDDCDGVIDDGLEQRLYYVDADGDGWGGGGSQLACQVPAGFTRSRGDCDDADPAVHPRADELCNGLDDDCDGGVDDDALDAAEWYLDADHDGYGEDDATTWACEAPAGYAPTGGDCNDTLAHIHPGATEICADTWDNDCSGDAPECYLSGAYDGEDANARFWGSAGDLLGHDIARAGALDATGADAFWVASAWTDAAGNNSGSVYLVGGPADLHGVGPVSAFADATLRGEAPTDGAGGAIDGGVDVDGDGIPDVLVGASGSDRGASNGGAAYLVYGPFAGTGSLADADEIYAGSAAGQLAANALAFLPDDSGTAGAWAAIGAFGDATGGAGAGGVFLVEPGAGDLSLAAASAFFVGENPGDQAGVALSRVGDFDGDGIGDLVLGAHQNDAAAANAGAAYVVSGPFAGVVDLSAAELKLTGEAAGDIAGYIVSDAGDVDSDGLADVYVAAPNQDAAATDGGAVYLVLGGTSGTRSLATADAKYVGTGASTQLGVGAANAGDVNGDGIPDLVCGGRGYTHGGAATGGAWVYFQPTLGTRMVSAADVSIGGLVAGDSFGDRVQGVGDVDNDGFSDLAINATYDASGYASGGAVYVFLSPGF